MPNFNHIFQTLSSFKKEFLFFSAVGASATFIGLLTLLTLPASIESEKKEKLQIGEALNFTVLGTFDKKQITAHIEPRTAIELDWKDISPFEKQVVVQSKHLLKPQENYTVRFTVKNYLGIESQKTISIRTDSLPKVLAVTPDKDQSDVFPNTPLVFDFDKELSTNKGMLRIVSNPSFLYNQKIIGKKLIIQPRSKLIQGQKYNLKLTLSDQHIGDNQLYEGGFTIINPVEVVSSEPADGGVSVLKQSTISFSFNKSLVRPVFERVFQISPPTAGTFEWSDDKNVKFAPKEVLQTNTKYTLTLPEAITAQDGSQLKETKILTFTSAGPIKVSSIGPTGSYFPTNLSIRVTFDQPVDHLSAEKKFSITPGVGGGFTWSGNTMIFQPNSLSPLTKYDVKIVPGIKTIGGEDSNQTFSNSFTTTSERVVTIGQSVKGRAINAYYFGLGPKKILLVASLHGNESNTKTMLDQWIAYLRSNQGAIGTDRTFVIVPNANPDGVVAHDRFNANGVDLNRNWDLPDWQAQTYWGNNSYPNGGGNAPFSEPETKSLSNLIISENPVRIVTYHSAANLVIGGGISNNFAAWYAGQTGYGLSTGGEEDEGGGSCQSVIGYCVTGTMEEWAGKRGNPTIVVEFATVSASEYTKNLPALKGLLTLPL